MHTIFSKVPHLHISHLSKQWISVLLLAGLETTHYGYPLQGDKGINSKEVFVNIIGNNVAVADNGDPLVGVFEGKAQMVPCLEQAGKFKILDVGFLPAVAAWQRHCSIGFETFKILCSIEECHLTWMQHHGLDWIMVLMTLSWRKNTCRSGWSQRLRLQHRTERESLCHPQHWWACCLEFGIGRTSSKKWLLLADLPCGFSATVPQNSKSGLSNWGWWKAEWWSRTYP